MEVGAPGENLSDLPQAESVSLTSALSEARNHSVEKPNNYESELLSTRHMAQYFSLCISALLYLHSTWSYVVLRTEKSLSIFHHSAYYIRLVLWNYCQFENIVSLKPLQGVVGSVV